MSDILDQERKRYFHGRVESLQIDSDFSAAVINGVEFPNDAYNRVEELFKGPANGDLVKSGGVLQIVPSNRQNQIIGFIIATTSLISVLQYEKPTAITTPGITVENPYFTINNPGEYLIDFNISLVHAGTVTPGNLLCEIRNHSDDSVLSCNNITMTDQNFTRNFLFRNRLTVTGPISIKCIIPPPVQLFTPCNNSNVIIYKIA